MLEYLKDAGIVVGVLSACYAFYRVGLSNAKCNSAFVKKEECESHHEKIERTLGELHEKVNRSNEGIARLEGKLAK